MKPHEKNRQPDGILAIRTQAMPKDCNASGDIFGGWLMSQMDIGGGLLASELAQGRVVTVTVDKMVFERPVHVGDVLCVHAKLIHIGNSSINIKVEVWAKELLEKYEEERHIVTEGLFRYVAVDKNGKSRIIEK